MDLEDLRVLIATRYGLTIDRSTLAALAQDGRVQRTNIEVLEAVALILQVRVDDLLDVRDMEPADTPSAISDPVLLDQQRDARLRELATVRDQGDRPLTEEEARELETLIAEMGRAMVERDIAAAAQRLGLPVEVVRDRIAAQTTDATRFWSDLVADPMRMASEVAEAKARRQAG
jgi:hypothetical protein